MARLGTLGFEWGDSRADLLPSGGANSASVSAVRSGTYGARPGASAISWNIPGTTALARTYYLRSYFRKSGNPSVDYDLLTGWTAGSTAETPYAVLKTDGTVVLEAPKGTTVGSASSVLNNDTWYRVELSFQFNSGANDDHAALQIDGVAIASTTTYAGPTVVPNRIVIGEAVATGVNIDFDDLALNDATGATHNSWPGATSGVLLLVPTADAQVGIWTGGALGTTNLWEAINNKPPTGTATETDLTQIENTDGSPDNATDEYRITMQSYTAAGVPTGATVDVAHSLIWHGEDVATGVKTGSVLIASNPTQATADTFTFGEDIGALGTFTTNWRPKIGEAQSGAGVTIGTAPVVHLRKTDTGTRVASVCAVGIYVEYTAAGPAASLLYPPRSPTIRQI